MPKAIITGGAGFIGSNLAIKMVKSGWQVIAIDDLSFGSKNNIDSILTDDKFTFVESDIRKPGLLDSLAGDARAIIHLAAYKIPRYGKALATLTVINEATRLVLESASRHKIKTILASTSDVYGKNPDPPFRESDNLVLGSPYVRRWAYAVSKAFDEQLAMAYHTEKGLPVVITRFFGSYGPHNHRSWWGGPQAVFIEQALQNKPLTVHGDGRQTRSFCYIGDTVAGIMAALESDKVVGEVVNLGSDDEISIAQLAETVIAMTNSDSGIEFTPYEDFGGRYEDVRNRAPDLSKARELLNFEPEVGLEDGLRKTIAWHKKFPRMAD